MNRIIPLFLFGLLLYNMVGYSIVYLTEERYEIGVAGKRLVQEFGSDEIMLKIPVAVPYQTDWNAPEPAEGQIRHEGQFYQLKSRQLLSDTLYVLCESDQNARERFSDLVSKITDQVTGQSSEPQKTSHASILKHFLKDYMSRERKHVFYLLEWASARTVVFKASHFILTERHHSVPSPPPDLA